VTDPIVRIEDPQGAAADPGLPWLARALDPVEIEHSIRPSVPAADGRRATLLAAGVVHHRPGRRCVVTYDFETKEDGHPPRRMRIYGKIRGRGADLRTQQLLSELRRRGLRLDSSARVAVPEPLGAVPALHMTLQRGAPGECATALLDGPQGLPLMPRLARAIRALHASGAPARRSHGMRDELDILRERLAQVARLRPDLETRLSDLLSRCVELGARLDRPGRNMGIHRDFYSDQVVVDGGGGDAITLLDLDLYAAGDPALDVGNFGGHLIEHGLRRYGDPAALRDRTELFFDSYCRLADDVDRADLDGYATLTLARHIQISTRIADRRHTTDQLVALCEERLGGVLHRSCKIPAP